MRTEQIKVENRICFLAGEGEPDRVFYWGIGEKAESITGQKERVEQMAKRVKESLKCASVFGEEQECTFLLAAYQAEDWNRDFSPWKAPAVFGDRSFSGCAEDTKRWLLEALVPYITEHCGAGMRSSERYLGGYSLAGLFSLWTFYESGAFGGVASCSGSLWFPGWEKYMRRASAPPASRAYLSLGDREEDTRSQIMGRVGEHTRLQYALLQQDPNITDTVLEWNPGGHFRDPDGRMAKGVSWLLQR